MSTTTDQPALKPRRRWLRWVFIVAAVAGLTYLGVKTYGFLTEAQMSLGLNRTPGIGIDALLVNRTEWHPPQDSILRPAQIHTVLRIVEAIDTLDQNGASREDIRTSLADLMNEHLFDRTSYTWSRDAVIEALERQPTTHVDSVNHELLTMYRPRFQEHRRVFDDSLDAMLLKR